MVVGIMTIGISMLILFHVPKVRHDKYYVYIFHEKKNLISRGFTRKIHIFFIEINSTTHVAPTRNLNDSKQISFLTFQRSKSRIEP